MVHRRLPEYEPRDRLRGWLGAIARKVAARFRARGSHRTETDDAGVDAQDDVFDLAAEIASAEEVFEVLQDVDLDLRFVFVQHYFDEVPIVEIAKHEHRHEDGGSRRLF